MKKYVLLLVFILFMPLVSSGDETFLKLRASKHTDFLRIVLEGNKSIIDNGKVYQAGEDILVKFPGMPFSIKKEKIEVGFAKKDEDSIMFYPGAFRGLKVFTLDHPDRLVIDIYQKGSRRPARSHASPPLRDHKAPSVPYPSQPAGKKKKTFPDISTVIIDPGHGGYDNGLVKGGYREKKVVLDISRKLNSLLNRGSFKGFLTRGSDRFMTQQERAEVANARGPEIFVSIHIGGSKNIVIYVPVITEDVSDIVRPHLHNKGQEEHIQKTMTLLNAMREAISAEFGEDMVSVQPLPYSILSKTESASLLIELPSFDSTDYAKKTRMKLASTLYKGFYIYEEIKIK
jgi:N-acetylmuramoyl-L-alanine amidase